MFSFYVKCWTDKRADKKTDRWTPVKQYTVTPDLSMQVHEKTWDYMEQC